MNLRIWAINLYTKALSDIYSESEEKIIKPGLSIEGISPEYDMKESFSFQWFPPPRNIPSNKRQSLENAAFLELTDNCLGLLTDSSDQNSPLYRGERDDYYFLKELYRL